MQYSHLLTANSRKSYGLRAALVVLSLTAISLTASAQTTGTWSGATNASWATSTNWNGTPPDNTGTVGVVYDTTSTTGLTDTLDGSYSITSIADSSTSGVITINNGTGTNTLTIGSGGITVAPTSGSTNGLVITTAVTLDGNQTWNVNNSYTGSGGADALNNSEDLAFVAAAAGTVFNLNGSQVVLSNTGTVAFSSGYVLEDTVGGGSIDVNEGTLDIQSGGSRNTSSSVNLQVDSGASLRFQVNSNSTPATAVVSTGTITLNGGTLILSQNTSTANSTLNLEGAMVVATSSTISVTNSPTGSGGQNNPTFISGNMSGTGGVTFTNSSGTTTLTLSGNDTYTGNTVISGNGNGITLTGTMNGTSGVKISGSGALYVNSGGVLTTSGLLQIGSGTAGETFSVASGGTVNAQSASVVYNPNSFALNGTMNVSGTFIVGTATSTTLSGTGTVNTGGFVTDNGVTLTESIANLNFNNSTGSLQVGVGTTFSLSTSGTITLTIGVSGTNNSIANSGTLSLNGTLAFDLTHASDTVGDSWNVVTGGSSGAYGANFTLNGFTNNGSGIWTDGNYQFDESTGVLSVIAVPEPSTIALTAIFGAGMLMLFRRRRNA